MKCGIIPQIFPSLYTKVPDDSGDISADFQDKDILSPTDYVFCELPGKAFKKQNVIFMVFKELQEKNQNKIREN